MDNKAIIEQNGNDVTSNTALKSIIPSLFLKVFNCIHTLAKIAESNPYENEIAMTSTLQDLMEKGYAVLGDYIKAYGVTKKGKDWMNSTYRDVRKSQTKEVHSLLNDIIEGGHNEKEYGFFNKE